MQRLKIDPRETRRLALFTIEVESMHELQTTLFAVLTVTPPAADDTKPAAAQPNGWTYPFSCCSVFDCREIRERVVVEDPIGYPIKGIGELITSNGTPIKNSPDGQFHQYTVSHRAAPTNRASWTSSVARPYPYICFLSTAEFEAVRNRRRNRDIP